MDNCVIITCYVKKTTKILGITQNIQHIISVPIQISLTKTHKQLCYLRNLTY